eukprot:UN4196
MNDSRYTHDEKLRLIDSGFCVLLEDYTLLNAWFQQQSMIIILRNKRVIDKIKTETAVMKRVLSTVASILFFLMICGSRRITGS